MCHKEQKVYDDLDLLLADSGIEDKTTLYVQLPEKDLCSPKNFLSWLPRKYFHLWYNYYFFIMISII